jgi:hypothetical protein
VTEETQQTTEGQVSDTSKPSQVDQTTTTTKGQEPKPSLDVDSLRRELEDARKEAAKYRTERKDLAARVAAFEAKQQAEEEAKLSEQEKTQKQATELAKKLSEYETRVIEAEAASRALALRTAIIEAAPKVGIAYPAAAVKLLDTSTLQLGDDGTPTNLDTALKTLLKDNPFLGLGAVQVSATNPAKGASSPGVTDEARERYIRAKVFGQPDSMFNVGRAKAEGGGVVVRDDQ